MKHFRKIGKTYRYTTLNNPYGKHIGIGLSTLKNPYGKNIGIGLTQH